jgi:hypothetical protein
MITRRGKRLIKIRSAKNKTIDEVPGAKVTSKTKSPKLTAGIEMKTLDPTLSKYANVYVKNKAKLIPLMKEHIGGDIPKDATHSELATVYIELLKSDPEFLAKVDGMSKKFKNATGLFDGIANIIGGGLNVAGGVIEGKNIERQSEADQDAALYSMILEKQKQNNSKTVWIVAGVSVVAVGGLIYFLVKRKK